MTGDEDERLLTVRAGDGTPPQMRMTVDTVLGPLSIGSSGNWTILAPGVLGEHGYIYFDGVDLFLQSADLLDPLLLNGQPVPNTWTPAYSPCEIRLGSARIQFTNPSSTVRISPPPPAPSPADNAAIPFHPLSKTVMMDPPRPAAGGELPKFPRPGSRPPPRKSSPAPAFGAPLPPPALPSPSAPAPAFGSPLAPIPAPTFGGAAALPFQQPQVPLLRPTPAPPRPAFGSPQTLPLVPPFAPPPSMDLGPTPEPPPPPRAAGSLELPPKRRDRPFAPGAFSNRDNEPDPDATRLHPIEMVAAERGAKVKTADASDAPPPLAEMPRSEPPFPPAEPFNAPPFPPAEPFNAPPFPPAEPFNAPPLAGVPPLAPPGLPPPGAAPPQGSAASAQLAALKASWNEASFPKKMLVVLFPALIGAVWVIFSEPPPPPAPRPQPPAASASAATSARLAAPSIPSEKPSAGEPIAPPETATAATEKPPSGFTPRPAETSRPAPAPPSAPNAGGKTAQREAADAVAMGDFAEAARLYEELAKAHPEVAAYAEAARIMRGKAK